MPSSYLGLSREGSVAQRLARHRGLQGAEGHRVGRRPQAIRYWHAHAKPDLIRCWNETRAGDCTVGSFRG